MNIIASGVMSRGQFNAVGLREDRVDAHVLRVTLARDVDADALAAYPKDLTDGASQSLGPGDHNLRTDAGERGELRMLCCAALGLCLHRGVHNRVVRAHAELIRRKDLGRRVDVCPAAALVALEVRVDEDLTRALRRPHERVLGVRVDVGHRAVVALVDLEHVTDVLVRTPIGLERGTRKLRCVLPRVLDVLEVLGVGGRDCHRGSIIQRRSRDYTRVMGPVSRSRTVSWITLSGGYPDGFPGGVPA